MTDHQDNRTSKSERGGDSVTTLASRAIEAVVSRKSRGRPPLSEKLLDHLVESAHAGGEEGVAGAIADLLHSGVPHDEVLDFYIPEAARRLGDAWCDDLLSFTYVTIGSARLQRAVRKLSEESYGHGRRTLRNSIVVVALEGQTHTLGATLVTEQLRRQNVSVRLMIGATPRDVLATVADGSFDAIFLSAAVEQVLEPIRVLVEKLRAEMGKGIPILVGGAVCNMGLDVQKLTGADHAVTDAKEALRLCDLIHSQHGASRPRAGA